MSDSRKQSVAILSRVADFLQNLPDEHLAELEAGTAMLTIIPAGATEPLKRSAPRPRGPKAAAVDVNKIAEAVRTAETREEAITVLRPLRKDPDLDKIKGFVTDSGEGRWTVQEAIDLDVPAPLITLSLLTRFRSRQSDSWSARLLAALRNEFGGHAVKKT